MQPKELHILLIAAVYIAPQRCESLDKGVLKPFKNIPLPIGSSSDIKIEEEVALSAPKFTYASLMFKKTCIETGYSMAKFCIAEGNPTPNITWYKNKETLIKRPFPTSKRIDVFYLKWSFSLQNLTKEDAGNYTCVVCNQLGCIDHTTQLRVQEQCWPEPMITNGYPGNVTTFLNETVTLKCPIISQGLSFVIWVGPLKYSVDLNEIDTNYFKLLGNSIQSQNPKDKQEQLTFYNVTKEAEGWYVCLVMNIDLDLTAHQGYLKILKPQPFSVEAAFEKVGTVPVYSPFITIIFICAALLIVVALVVVTTCRKLNRKKKQKRLALETARHVIETYWSKKVTIEKPYINTSHEAAGALILPIIKIENQKVTELKKNTTDSKMLSEYDLPLDENWEVPRETIVLRNVLGEGEFGKVVKADCVGVLKRGQSSVAVKMLKDGHNDAEMMSLVSEMEIMKVVGKHVNIINLLGCCTQGGPLYVIVEFANYGDLRNFLRKHRSGIRTESANDGLEDSRNLTPQDLASFAYQVAKGMEYLALKHCIHRDLAARNVLVSENFILKIADFGLAKNIETDYYYRKKTSGKLPVRWMAPESLNSMLFTIQTDVWSYGILLWEIMTLGATPYQTIQAHFLFQHLRAGHRLEKPPNCSLDLYLLMRECWSFSPKDRPPFTLLVKELEKILTKTTNVEYLNLNSPESENSQVTKTLWLSRNTSLKKEASLSTADG